MINAFSTIHSDLGVGSSITGLRLGTYDIDPSDDSRTSVLASNALVELLLGPAFGSAR